MIEDCSLHATGMPVIVWLMLYLTQLRSRWRQSVEAANDHTAAPPVKRRKFTPSIKVLDHRGLLLLLRWTLGLAEQLCLIPVRDAFMLLQMDEKSTERAVEGILNDLPSSVVENHGADQLLSMRIRRLFGGMRSDLLMFDRACLVWHERLLINDDGVQCAALQQQQPIRLNPEQFRLLVDHLTKTPLKLPSMRPKDWLLAAIDHHVSPIAGRLWRESFTPEDRQLISSTYGCNQHHDDNNDEDELGERFVGDMIWTQSSSVNWRENHSATEEGFLHSEFWRKYRSEFDRLAMEILCRRLYN
jgi:hypothetical protein